MISLIQKALQKEASPETAASLGRFFKEKPCMHGIPMPKLRLLAKEFQELSFDDCHLLLGSSYQEERLLALLILCRRYRKTPETVYDFYLEHLTYVDNWNLVDASAHLIIGEYLWGKGISLLEKLAESPSLWKRRIAIVATWAFIKKGDVTATEKIATRLLQDKEDLIHKAVGWMLREAGKKDRLFLERFLQKQKDHMPRTMLRYAIEKFSADERAIWMRQTRSCKMKQWP